MFPTRRAAGIFGVVAGASFVIFAGPAAMADQTVASNSHSSPCVTATPEPSAPAPDPSASPLSARYAIVDVAKPDSPGNSDAAKNNGKSDKAQENGTTTRDQAKDQTKDQAKDQTRDADCVQDGTQTAAEVRAALRDQIRTNGGSWGSYQRQGALVGVASRLAERYSAGQDITDAASLGRILTLVNLWLPEDLKVDTTALLAEYGLTPADITWPAGTVFAPVPSPSPSESPSPSASS